MLKHERNKLLCTQEEIGNSMTRNKKTVLVIHNIISPYKTILFNALNTFNEDFELKVLYIAETEKRRQWDIQKNGLHFSYEIMFDKPADEVHIGSLFMKTWVMLKKNNPDLLIADGYSYASSWAGKFWSRIHRKNSILWSSSNEADHERVFYKEFFKKIIIKGFDAYNVYGTKSRDYLIKLGAEKDKIFIVGNNTDNNFYYNETMKWKRERPAIIKDFGIPDNNFLYIGRFSEEKNIVRLLDAYKGLKSGQQWGLIVVGSGPQKEGIANYIKTHNIENVFMPGFKQKNEIPKYMAVSDVFILPGISETWGLVVNEAMAAGLPILVSRRCGCSADLVREGDNGYTFDPFDKDELYSIMRKIVDGKVNLKKMGEASLLIIKEFTPERAASIVAETIELVLKDR